MSAGSRRVTIGRCRSEINEPGELRGLNREPGGEVDRRADSSLPNPDDQFCYRIPAAVKCCLFCFRRRPFFRSV